MLLVMSTSGVLVDPSLPPAMVDGALVDTELDLWELTWTKIVKFLPTLQDELFPKATEGNFPSFFHMHPPSLWYLSLMRANPSPHPTGVRTEQTPSQTPSQTNEPLPQTPAQQRPSPSHREGSTSSTNSTVTVWESNDSGSGEAARKQQLRTVGLNV